LGIVQIVFTIVLILGLVYLYKRSDRSEDLLLLKLLGYYLLGSFRFNFNKIAIPFGFLVYLLFLHPNQNARSKRQAAGLGLVFLIVGLAQPTVENYLYQLPIEVKSESVNLYDINFPNDWQSLQQQLQLTEDVRLVDFYSGFESDGSIRELSYKLISQKDGGIVHYNVNLEKQHQAYVIRRSKIDRWLQYDQEITAQRFFEAVESLDINKLKPKGDYGWYTMSSQGVLSYDIPNHDKYILDNNGDVLAVGNEELPIRGYFISLYGMYKLNEITHEGRGFKDYFYYIVKN